MDKYIMSGSKMMWHPNKVLKFFKGEKFAPISIDAGLSKGCNLHCTYCFGYLQKNAYKAGINNYFPREAMLNYMRSAGECGVKSIALIGEAEPLVNPYWHEAVVEGRKAGVDMSVGTNGVLLDIGIPETLQALKALTCIRFNISAASENSYKEVHRSEEFDIALMNIEWCVAMKRTYNIDITIGLQMVLTPENLKEVVPLAKLGQELGVDYLVVKQCSDSVDGALGIYDRLGQYLSFDDVLKEAENYETADYDVIIKWEQIKNKGVRTYGKCLAAPFLLYTSGDGLVYPCGMFFADGYEKYLMGDLKTQSFKEIIESKQYWDVVDEVTKIDVCKNCYSNCKSNNINTFLWNAKDMTDEELDDMFFEAGAQIPPHVNFV